MDSMDGADGDEQFDNLRGGLQSIVVMTGLSSTQWGLVANLLMLLAMAPVISEHVVFTVIAFVGGVGGPVALFVFIHMIAEERRGRVEEVGV